MQFNVIHNNPHQVRQQDRRGNQLKPHIVEIFCHKHPDKVVLKGCLEPDCEQMTICVDCERENPSHQREHYDQIVDFNKFLEIMAAEIKKVNRSDSQLYKSNIRRLVENEHSLEQEFTAKCNHQIKHFAEQIDELALQIINSLSQCKEIIKKFFESIQIVCYREQIQQNKNNILMFKSQLMQMNPEESYERFGDAALIASKLITKTSHQCYVFLRNLRKSANMEGQVIGDLDYISQQILNSLDNKEHMVPDFVFTNLKTYANDLIQSSKSLVVDNLRDIPSLDNAYTHSDVISSSFISQSRHQIRLQMPNLFDQMKKYNIRAVSQVQTHHTNSVSAVVTLSEDIVATASYDRSIKFWRLSTGQLLRTIFDKNCISSLIVFYLKHNKNPQSDQLTDDDINILNQSLLENPNKKLSDHGLLLISGGFDKEVKVWDVSFNGKDQRSQSAFNNDSISFSYLAQSSISNLYSQPYQLTEFPLKALQGHVSWITALCSLEDQSNIASADDTGEIIIWNIIKGTLHQRIPYNKVNTITPFITLLNPQKYLCTSSSTILRIYRLFYHNNTNLEESVSMADRIERKFRRQTETQIQLSPQLDCLQIYKEINIGWTIHACLSPYNYREQGILIVVGGLPHKMKYVQVGRGRQIEIQGDWNGYIGSILVIEKFNIKNTLLDKFYQNINLLICGDKQLGLYDGYGNMLRHVQPENPEDLYASNLLCQRNMQLLKVTKKGQHRIVKFVVASQYSSEAYNYKSSKITSVELEYDILEI